MKKIELLSPAGNYEKMLFAAAYGADAVYFGGNDFSLRASSDNFSIDDFKNAFNFLHNAGIKAYVTLNITARNSDVQLMAEYAQLLWKLGADAFIVSDAGVMRAIRRQVSDARIHISTQANVTNYEAASMYHELGASRIVLARELSLNEISGIRERVPESLELEVFVHGSMCMAYSGRCLLSSYLTGRDGNRGDCAQACRWKYSLMEEKRPGEYMLVEEDSHGAYIMNSKDLCLINRIPELISAGVDSFKIEGRMKSIFYVATVTGTYRAAIDSYFRDPGSYVCRTEWLEALTTVSHREYMEGFLDGSQRSNALMNYTDSSYIRGYTFCAIVRGYDEDKKLLTVEQRNNFRRGDVLEVVSPGKAVWEYIAGDIYNEEGALIEAAPHPQMKVKLPWEAGPIPEFSFLRRKNKETQR